jgi:hypothetical protein
MWTCFVIFFITSHNPPQIAWISQLVMAVVAVVGGYGSLEKRLGQLGTVCGPKIVDHN